MPPTNSWHISTTHFLLFGSQSYKYSVGPKDINGIEDDDFRQHIQKYERYLINHSIHFHEIISYNSFQLYFLAKKMYIAKNYNRDIIEKAYNDYVLQCKWSSDGKIHTITNRKNALNKSIAVLKPHFNDASFCYTFQSPPISKPSKSNEPIDFQLGLVLHNLNSNYNPNSDFETLTSYNLDPFQTKDTKAFHVTLHSHLTAPAGSNFIKVHTGRKTTITIEPTRITHLPHPYSNCKENSKLDPLNISNGNLAYTKQGCIYVYQQVGQLIIHSF